MLGCDLPWCWLAVVFVRFGFVGVGVNGAVIWVFDVCLPAWVCVWLVFGVWLCAPTGCCAL